MFNSISMNFTEDFGCSLKSSRTVFMESSVITDFGCPTFWSSFKSSRPSLKVLPSIKQNLILALCSMFIFVSMTQTYGHFRRNNFASSERNIMKLEVEERMYFPTHQWTHRWCHQKISYLKSPVYFGTHLVFIKYVCIRLDYY